MMSDNSANLEFVSADDDMFVKHIKTLPAFRGLLRSMEAKMISRLYMDGPILDVGCGDGHFGGHVLSTGSTIGIDISIRSLMQAKTYNSYRHVLQTDDKGYPFPDSYFGSVLCNSVLEHIPDVNRTISEIRRVLKPESQFVFTVPTEFFTEYLLVGSVLRSLRFNRISNWYIRFFNKISRHYHYNGERKWKLLLERHGFTIESCVYYCSKDALRAIEIGHYFGLPSLISKILFGKWVLVQSKENLMIVDKLFRKYYDENLPEVGAYMLVVAK